MFMPLEALKAQIIAGQSLSSAFDCTIGTLLTITIPMNWTPANVSFQVSADGADYYDVVDDFGNEISRTAVAGTALTFGWGSDWKSMHIKIRSGSTKRPVKQIEDVEFTVAIVT